MPTTVTVQSPTTGATHDITFDGTPSAADIDAGVAQADKRFAAQNAPNPMERHGLLPEGTQPTNVEDLKLLGPSPEAQKDAQRQNLIKLRNQIAQQGDDQRLDLESSPITSAAAGAASVPLGMVSLLGRGTVAAINALAGEKTAGQFESDQIRMDEVAQKTRDVQSANPLSGAFGEAGALAATSGGAGPVPDAITLAKAGMPAGSIAKTIALRSGIGAGVNTAVGTGVRLATGQPTGVGDITQDIVLGAALGPTSPEADAIRAAIAQRDLPVPTNPRTAWNTREPLPENIFRGEETPSAPSRIGIGDFDNRVPMPGESTSPATSATAVALPQQIADENHLANLIRSKGVGVNEAGELVSPEVEKASQGAIPEELLNKQAADYRKILNPGKSEINKIEVKSGKDLSNYFKLAAQEGLVITRSPENKLDTTVARAQLDERAQQLNNQVQQILASQPDAQFDLNELRAKATGALRKTIKNDLDFKNASNQVNAEIDAAIEARGDNSMVNAQDLNAIKSGMWSKSYDPLAPNNQKVARQIGFAAKDAIEKAFPDQNIASLNARLGDYLTLETLLRLGHGRIVDKGKLGKYVAQGTGALMGHTMGLPGGEIVGAFVGGKVNSFLTDPERLTQSMADKTKKYRSIADQIEDSSTR